MAKKGGVVAQATSKSTRTGRFYPCQSNSVPGVHPTPVASAIKVGPARVAFVHCGCGDHHFWTKAADPMAVGYTQDEIVRMGYVVVG